MWYCEIMNNKYKTNKKVIKRLSMYRSALARLVDLGFSRVSSGTLAEEVGVSSAVVRKDFSYFKIKGNKKAGYRIEEVIESLDVLLAKNEIQKAIIAGVGKVGEALMMYKGFKTENIEILAGFDIDPSKVNRRAAVPVLPFDELPTFIRKNNIVIGIITVPESQAQKAMEVMVRSGIKGILNFAPITLRLPDGHKDCIISYVNIALELENLSYFVKLKKKNTGVSDARKAGALQKGVKEDYRELL
jgi:redox-sensing transcriptional repressor